MTKRWVLFETQHWREAEWSGCKGQRTGPVQSSPVRQTGRRACRPREIDRPRVSWDSAWSPDAWSFATCDEPWVWGGWIL